MDDLNAPLGPDKQIFFIYTKIFYFFSICGQRYKMYGYMGFILGGLEKPDRFPALHAKANQGDRPLQGGNLLLDMWSGRGCFQ